MRKSTKAVAAVLVAGALLLPGGAALAGTSYTGWSATLPALQQGVIATYQTKAVAGTSGQIRVDTTGGSGYKVNARMCGLIPSQCGPTVVNLAPVSAAFLPNNFVRAGNTAFLQLFLSVISVVRVDATGVFRSN